MLEGIRMDNKMYFVNCPICGRSLLKGLEIMKAELQCGKCHEVIVITVKVIGENVELYCYQKSKDACA